MSIVVEHDKRRKEILEKAVGVFMDEGFENATFQRIADRCGITRTILYIYFKNKKEIFNFSIKQLMLKAEENIKKTRCDNSKNNVEKIIKVLLDIIALLEQNRQLLSVILDYLLYISSNDSDPEIRIRRRTVRLRRILASMIIEGVKSGELKKVKIKTANYFLYNFIEAAIFQLVVLKRQNLEELKATVVFAVKHFSEE
jgi:AcrR family transcriptional regulator